MITQEGATDTIVLTGKQYTAVVNSSVGSTWLYYYTTADEVVILIKAFHSRENNELPVGGDLEVLKNELYATIRHVHRQWVEQKDKPEENKKVKTFYIPEV